MFAVRSVKTLTAASYASVPMDTKKLRTGERARDKIVSTHSRININLSHPQMRLVSG